MPFRSIRRNWGCQALLVVAVSALGWFGAVPAQAQSPFHSYLEVPVTGATTVANALAAACPDVVPTPPPRGVLAADSPERALCLERRQDRFHAVNAARMNLLHRFFTTDYQSAVIRFVIALGLDEYPALSAVGKVEQLSLAVTALLAKLQATTLKKLHDTLAVTTRFAASGSSAAPFAVSILETGLVLEINAASFEHGDGQVGVYSDDDVHRAMFAVFYQLGMEVVRQILWDPTRPAGIPVIAKDCWLRDVQHAVGISHEGIVFSGKNKFVSRFAELALMVPYQNKAIDAMSGDDWKRIEDYVIAWAADEARWIVDVDDPYFVEKFIRPVVTAKRPGDPVDTYLKTMEAERDRLAAIAFYAGILQSGVGNAYKEILGRSETLYQQSWASVAAQGAAGVFELGKTVASKVRP